MSVKAVVVCAVEAMLDHDVAAVIRMTGNSVNVDDGAIGDGTDLIERLAFLVAMHRLDIDAFVKAREGETTGSFDRIPHETVLAAFPRRGFLAFEIARDVLVEVRAAAVEERVVVGWEGELEMLRGDGSIE